MNTYLCSWITGDTKRKMNTPRISLQSCNPALHLPPVPIKPLFHPSVSVYSSGERQEELLFFDRGLTLNKEGECLPCWVWRFLLTSLVPMCIYRRDLSLSAQEITLLQSTNNLTRISEDREYISNEMIKLISGKFMETPMPCLVPFPLPYLFSTISWPKI